MMGAGRMSIMLRALKLEDADTSYQWRADPEIRANILGFRLPVSREREREWVEDTLRNRGGDKAVLAIESLEDHSLLGYVYLDKINWIDRTAWFGILIGNRDHHRRGVGKLATQQMLDYAKNQLNLRKILAEVVVYNQASDAFFRKLGFVEEGRIKEKTYLNAAYHDVCILTKML